MDISLWTTKIRGYRYIFALSNNKNDRARNEIPPASRQVIKVDGAGKAVDFGIGARRDAAAAKAFFAKAITQAGGWLPKPLR
ncbi:hypothetical protein [Caballeronia udeis]|uniref:hypothetical protein n=1 Tax=Caballeronia udeis TaxID=1232866 RepID=UPI000AD3527A|nr:hypothetical protein [Caballeronia udeis]